MNTNILLEQCNYGREDVIAFKNRGKYAIFSNFYSFDFTVKGVTFHSVEQYYHWRRLEGTPKYQETMLSFDGEKRSLWFNASTSDTVVLDADGNICRNVREMIQDFCV